MDYSANQVPPVDRSRSLEEALLERVRGLRSRFFEGAADRFILAALRHGDAKAIVLPEGEYEAFMLTLELEEDDQAQQDIRAGMEESRTGSLPTWDEFESELQHGSRQTDKAL